MKKLLLLTLLFAVAGCSRPREIPDRKLEAIFKEIFLVNAYCNSRTINTDSLDVYEPILHKYGYKPRDLVYTIGHFSRRKSARLSDILDASMIQLAKEHEGYNQRVALLDSINMVAKERFRQIVYTDTLLHITRLKDTARLRLEFPAREGQYKIAYRYLIDTVDKNGSVRGTQTLLDSAGRQIQTRTNWMQRGRSLLYETTLDAPARAAKLEVLLGNYNKTSTAPDLRIDTLAVIYYLPLEIALDSLKRSLLDYKLIIDGKEIGRGFAPDSVALRVDPPRIAPPRDTLP